MKDSNVKGLSREELFGRLSIAIRQSQNTSDAFDEYVAEALGINRTDLRALDVLDQRGAISAGELAAAMHLSSGAITTLLDRLERGGYATRRRDTQDRRRVLVELTPKMQELAAPFYTPLYFGTLRLLEPHSDEQIQAMIDILERGRELVEAELARMEAEAG